MSTELTLSPTLEVAITKLELRPVDILVVKVSRRLDPDLINRLTRHMQAMRADGGKVLVTDDAVEISVVKAVPA